MERQTFTPAKTVDSIMDFMADELSSTYSNSNASGFVDNSSLIDSDMGEFPALSKAEDPTALKSWREGFEIKAVDDGAAKTVFISQNLNKGYEEEESKLKFTSYTSAVTKICREIDYFTTILKRVGDDLKLTESMTEREKILEKREMLKEKLTGMKNVIDSFTSQKLTGEPLIKSTAPPKNLAKKSYTDYAFMGDKKPQASEKCISVNMCSDCNIEIVIEEGQDLDGALIAHSQTELHKASMPEPPPPRKSKLEGLGAQNSTSEPTDKKSIDNLKKSPILKLNRIASCLIDDNMACEVCDVVFPSHMQDIYKHMNEPLHKEKLNNFNIEAQRVIIEKNPDVFGEDGQFQISMHHTNLHKIFVDPSIKQAYCGLCCRQLPFSQSNIDEHVTSGKHEKVLMESVETSFAEFTTLGIDSSTLNNIKAKAVDNVEYASPNQNIKPKREPQPQRNMEQKDVSQMFLDVADIQNFRKVLPDKPIRSIPDILDSNNKPIYNFDYCEQPELKKFLIDNGLQRQAGGKFKCLYCPNLEIPNSRYAVRHINKHKMGTGGNSQCFENWKRPSNRQLYSNEPKLGRVVMHKNGVNYWCTSCRLPLIDASTAFAHCKTDNHHMFVDGVSFSSGTIFDCSTCKTTINGEKNACQHLVAAKHRENSKMDALAKQEGRMNMIEERKQKQYEKQKGDAMRNKEKASGEMHGGDEEKLFEKNGVIYSSDHGSYHCGYCRWSSKKRPEVLLHVFSYDHVDNVAKQSR